MQRIQPIVAALLLACPAAWSQSSAILRGQVLDPSGAAIPRAAITVSGPAGATKTAEADNSGNYRITGLPAGRYTVRAAAAGFNLFESSIDLSDGRVSSLDLNLAVASEKQEVTVAEQAQVAVDPSANATALVLDGKELDILSDNPDDLAADLLALAGPSVGPEGGQIFIDGFSNGQLPAKESIREIRINSDPFSAQYDKVGFGRIEVLTRPGSDHFRGSASMNFADSSLNTRNPYSSNKPATQMRQYQTQLAGSLNPKTSFNVEANHATQDQTALINALILDDSFQPVRYTLNTPAPAHRTGFTPRVDYALTPNNSLTVRYTINRNTNENNSIGNYSLLSRATTNENTQQNFQFVDTEARGAFVNEARFSYRRSRSQQTGNSNSPTISVIDAFTGGGAAFNANFYHSDNTEFHDDASYLHGPHSLKFGIRIRGTREHGFSTSNYNGTFTFTSINAYAITEQGLAQGQTLDQIRAAGGGPSQYSVAGGDPIADVIQVDAAPFIQDDWKLKPNFTLSTGLRYEIQNNIHDRKSWAPRLGVAWGIGKGRGRTNTPRTVLRGGFGLFYDRISESLTLQLHRQNGITQQQFVVTAPPFFPVAPPVSLLVSNRIPQAVRLRDADLEAPRILQSAIGIERQLPRNITVSVNFTDSRGLHQLRTRNINAPLPGTGVFPYGSAAGQLYMYESSAMFKQTQLTVNLNARVSPRMSLFANYTYGQAHSNTDGTNTFPSNTYDLSTEWGRASFDIHHRFQTGGSFTIPYAIQLAPQIYATSEPPLNITLGRDINGDSLFLERPAFATDLTRPSVRLTRFGDFDTDPLPGQTVIPRNYGRAYPNLSVNLRVTRAWGFGERSTAQGGRGRHYTLTASVQARNLINTVNPGSPSGDLSSPLFGVPTNIQGGSNANRRIETQVKFEF